MYFASKFRSFFGTQRRTRNVRWARRSRPVVESLEVRLAPAVFTVMNVNNSGTGSLRQAILDANAAAGPDTINFNVALAGQAINLTTMDGTQFGPNALEVTSVITIQGSGQTISRGATAPNFRLFYVSVSSTGNRALSNLTLSNGLAKGATAEGILAMTVVAAEEDWVLAERSSTKGD